MAEKHFFYGTDFESRLNQEHSPQDTSYIRAQYIKAIGGKEKA